MTLQNGHRKSSAPAPENMSDKGALELTLILLRRVKMEDSCVALQYPCASEFTEISYNKKYFIDPRGTIVCIQQEVDKKQRDE